MDLGGGPSSCAGLPVREISSQADLDQFRTSETYVQFYGFIQDLASSVVGRRISTCRSADASANVRALVGLLEEMVGLVREHLPVETNSRFGNPAFRDWLDAVRILVPRWHHDRAVPLAEEVSSYLLNSLGDWQRIDYGTGHEAHFVAWLYCLFHPATGPYLGRDEHAAAVLIVFVEYVRMMRRLQATYWLEPAGSHGVWGLDDYHFLPFLFGAAQLTGHEHIRPKSIHDGELVEEFAGEYLYLDCIDNINRVKSAGLRWHSPMLDDISAVRSWEKVHSGLVKMYAVEVLGKVPIMQHFLFGTLLPFKSTADRTNGGGHVHVLRGDCCGNPLPSIYAAAAAGAKGDAGEQRGAGCGHTALPRLPFD